MAVNWKPKTPLPDINKLGAVPGSFWHGLRARLETLGVHEDALRQFDFVGPDLGDLFRLPLQQWKARQQGDLASLAVAFLRLQEAVSWGELQQLFGGELAHGMLEAGFAAKLEGDGEAAPSFVCTLRLGALDGQWILADRHLYDADAVMGSSAATGRIHTATAVESRAWERDASLLDLGCGGGALALGLGRLAHTVAGCDISPRAVVLAHINATLNGLEDEHQPEFREGDLFAPFSARRFSRIVCQPPFLPEAGVSATFATGGSLGDAITLRILREIGDYLAPDGRAILCVEWAGGDDAAAANFGDWRTRVQQTLAGQGIMGIHCELFRTPAEDYCTLLAPYLFPPSDSGYGDFLKSMLHHYQRVGIRWIDLVLHFLEPAGAGQPVHAVRQVPLASLEHVTAGYADAAFRALRLAGMADPFLLASKLRAPAGFRVAGLDAVQPESAEVEFGPESLLHGGQLPVSAIAILEAAEGIRCDEMLQLLPGSSEESIALIRQMLLQGLIFAE